MTVDRGQEEPGGARGSQEEPRVARRSQEEPGGARRSQKEPWEASGKPLGSGPADKISCSNKTGGKSEAFRVVFAHFQRHLFKGLRGG